MKRRAFLAATVAGTAGLAGCGELGSSGPERGTLAIPESGESGSTGTVDLSIPDGLARTVGTRVGPPRRLAVSAVPGEAAPSGTRVTAGFVETATPESPPRLWIALTNVSEEARTLSFGATPPFSGYHGHEITWGAMGDVKLLLVPDDDREYANNDLVLPDDPTAERLPSGGGNDSDEGDVVTTTSPSGSGDCWRAASFFAGPTRERSVTLEPGASLEGEYAVLFEHDTRTCPPRRGGYYFQSPAESLPLVVATWDPGIEGSTGTTIQRSPPGLPGYDGTVWYHRTDENSPVYVAPTDERLALPGDETTIRFENFSLQSIRTQPNAWELYKLHDGQWKPLQPWIRTGQSSVIPPGGGDRIRLRVGRERLDTSDDSDRDDRRSVGGLGGGTYAVRHGTTGVVETRGRRPLRIDDTTGTDLRIVYAALLELDGDPATLLPASSVDQVATSEGTVWAWAVESGRSGIDSLRLEPIDPTPDPQLIVEQVNQSPALQHTLALSRDHPGAEKVVLSTDHLSVVDPIERFGEGGGDRIQFTFDGQGYRVEARSSV